MVQRSKTHHPLECFDGLRYTVPILLLTIFMGYRERLSDPLKDDRPTLPATNTKRSKAQSEVTSFHFFEKG